MKQKIKFLLATIMMLVGITAQAATRTVTWNASDIVAEEWAESFTKDGITFAPGEADFDLKNFSGGGTFTTASGKFTKIEVTAPYRNISGTGWEEGTSTGMAGNTWTGDASSSVSYSGEIEDSGLGELTIVFTIEESVAITPNSDGAATPTYWSTYYNATQGYTADENTTVYKAALNGTSSVTLTEVAGREIPAGQAVILKSSAASITLTPATTTADMSGNVLKGGTTVTDGNDAYTLSRGSAGTGPVGFYKFSGATLDGSKAHLEIPASAARSFIGFGDDNTTAIELPALADDEAAEWYSLDGRRLSGKPAHKGIYVRNGKKVVIK